MNRRDYLTGIFHSVIIASLLLGLGGCGYKAPPYYVEDTPAADENVKFIINKREFGEDTNTSCK